LFVRWAVAGSGFTALSLAFWRDLATAVLLLAGLAILRPRWLRVERRDLPWLVALGAVGVGTFHVVWNLTILNIGYAAATVVLYSAPVFVALIAWLLWREPLTRYKVLAIALTLAGCVLVAGREELTGVELTAGGLILGLTTALAYGGFSLFGRQVAGRYSPWTVLAYGFVFGTLVLLPFQFLTALPNPVPAQNWIWFAGLVIVATIVPYAAYLTALRWLPVSVAIIVASAEVAFGALWGYLFFGETLQPWHIAGAGLVVAGVVLVALKGNRG
jgi:drug/metabolite transporter (DMT)-like permease